MHLFVCDDVFDPWFCKYLASTTDVNTLLRLLILWFSTLDAFVKCTVWAPRCQPRAPPQVCFLQRVPVHPLFLQGVYMRGRNTVALWLWENVQTHFNFANDSWFLASSASRLAEEAGEGFRDRGNSFHVWFSTSEPEEMQWALCRSCQFSLSFTWVFEIFRWFWWRF